MQICDECGGEFLHLFRPYNNPNAPELCSDCQLEHEEATREREELDYLQAEYW